MGQGALGCLLGGKLLTPAGLLDPIPLGALGPQGCQQGQPSSGSPVHAHPLAGRRGPLLLSAGRTLTVQAQAPRSTPVTCQQSGLQVRVGPQDRFPNRLHRKLRQPAAPSYSPPAPAPTVDTSASKTRAPGWRWEGTPKKSEPQRALQASPPPSPLQRGPGRGRGPGCSCQGLDSGSLWVTAPPPAQGGAVSRVRPPCG